MIIRDKGVHCDTCQKPAPPVDEIRNAHGLIRLSWYCAGGTHVCPDCPHPRTLEQIAADREAAQPRKVDRNG